MKLFAALSILIFDFMCTETTPDTTTVPDIPNNSANPVQENTNSDDFDTEFKYRLTDSVKVQILDKISGEVIIKKLKVNEMFAFKRIRIVVRKCFISPVDKPLNYVGYVEIFHIPYSQNIEKVFSDWMFTENITINMFEHPVYDVKIIR